MQYIVPLAVGALGFLGQQQAAQAQREAARAGAEGAAAQRELVNYILSKRRTVYDPIEEKVFLPRMVERAKTPAPWAEQAGFWSRSLAAPMTFPREDRPR